MTRILIAVDQTEHSIEAAQAAHHLFGDDAEYFVMNVTNDVPFGLPSGFGFAVAMPSTALALGDAMIAPGAYESALVESGERARQIAAEVAQEADLPRASVLGDVGDPAHALLEAAHSHQADVIVVGSHTQGWISKLFRGSVAGAVVREADIPVLVVR
jgi:nucleotide-binding universal stress UspA family protein